MGIIALAGARGKFFPVRRRYGPLMFFGAYGILANRSVNDIENAKETESDPAHGALRPLAHSGTGDAAYTLAGGIPAI